MSKQTLGIRIRNLREDHDMTQKDLSALIGLTPKMISFYENEQRTPPIDILIRLAHIFNVSIDYLVGETSLTNSERLNLTHSITWNDVQLNFPNAIQTTEDTRELLEYYNELSHINKRWIMGQMIDLIKKQEDSEFVSLKAQ